ncbi:hypothetical protein MRX96_051124 [Rhipicephalus microplus]
MPKIPKPRRRKRERRMASFQTPPTSVPREISTAQEFEDVRGFQPDEGLRWRPSLGRPRVLTDHPLCLHHRWFLAQTPTCHQWFSSQQLSPLPLRRNLAHVSLPISTMASLHSPNEVPPSPEGQPTRQRDADQPVPMGPPRRAAAKRHMSLRELVAIRSMHLQSLSGQWVNRGQMLPFSPAISPTLILC